MCLAGTAPLAAQERSAPATLEDLIPDSAIDNAEEWASQGSDGQAVTAEQDDTPLPEADADTLPDMPEITLDWPDTGADIANANANDSVAQVEPIERVESDGEVIEFQTFEDTIPPLPEGSEEKISSELVLVFPSEKSLFPERDEFLDRFKALSTVRQLDDNDNQAVLSAQAREDETLLLRLLRIYGYYDSQVIRSTGNFEQSTDVALDQPAARFDIIPGRRYTVGDVDLGNLHSATADYEGLRASYEVFPGDYIDLDAIESEQFDLDVALGESGYPFAVIDAPELLVDHDRSEGDVTMEVEPGGKYNFGQITSNLPRFMSAHHLGDIARFEGGQTYKRSQEMDLRQAILATGIAGSVRLTPVEAEAPRGDAPGTVDIAVEMTEAPLRTIAGALGYGTEEGFKLEASWEHRNLFPPEGSLRIRGIAGTKEQLLGATFRKNNFHGRDRALSLDAFVSTIDYDAYDARTASVIGTFEKTSTLLLQKPFSWSVGLELVATRERERNADGSFQPFETYFIGAVPLYAQFDRSDDLLDPTEGFRLSAKVSPEIASANGTQYFYARNQADFSYYQGLGDSDKVVLAARARVANITGAPLDGIAPSRRLYAGGGGSVRGYGYREIGPRDTDGDPTGGRSLVELSLEARIKTGLLDGALGIVPFLDAGTVGTGSVPSFDNIQFGAGIGARYLTGFGPLRLDVAVPLNPGPDDGWIAVYVALGQAF